MLSAGISLSAFFNIYYRQQKRDNLAFQGEKISQMMLTYRKGEITAPELGKWVDAIAETNNTKISIIGRDRLRIISSRDVPDISRELQLRDYMQAILQNQVVSNMELYSKTLNSRLVFVGMPLKQGEDIYGVLMQFSPLSELEKTIKNVNRIIWSITIFFMVISSIFIYLASLKISKPITEVGKAALKVAEGDFGTKIEIRGDKELRQLAYSFNFMNDKLSKIEDMRRELIANVSHELRTPLASIRGFVHGMIDGVIPHQEYSKYHNIMLDEINRLTKLINDLLELAKFQAGSVELTPTKCHIKKIVQEVVENLSIQAQKKTLDIHVSGDDEITAVVDRDRIKQVFINIINNAIQYSKPQGSIHINIVKEKNVIRTSISDNAIGIPAQDLPYIFEKFHRVDKSRKTATGGTGLGLSIVKHIIELHGGTVSARSIQGKGTEIIFVLPAR